MTLECRNPFRPTKFNTPFARCRKCPECLMVRSMEWRTRIIAEAASTAVWPFFVTLTYADAPGSQDEAKECLRLFWQRLRRSLPVDNRDLRYFVCTEFGSKNGRIHHHAIIWSSHMAVIGSVNRYRLMDDCWKLGRTNTRAMRDLRGFSYVSKYVTKDENWYSCSKNLGRSTWQQYAGYITALHEVEEFTAKKRPPPYMQVFVLNRPYKLKIPENVYLKVCSDLGVQSKTHPIELVSVEGVPNGPLDMEFIRDYIRSGNVAVKEFDAKCLRFDPPEEFGQQSFPTPLPEIQSSTASEPPKSSSPADGSFPKRFQPRPFRQHWPTPITSKAPITHRGGSPP